MPPRKKPETPEAPEALGPPEVVFTPDAEAPEPGTEMDDVTETLERIESDALFATAVSELEKAGIPADVAEPALLDALERDPGLLVAAAVEFLISQINGTLPPGRTEDPATLTGGGLGDATATELDRRGVPVEVGHPALLEVLRDPDTLAVLASGVADKVVSKLNGVLGTDPCLEHFPGGWAAIGGDGVGCEHGSWTRPTPESPAEE